MSSSHRDVDLIAPFTAFFAMCFTINAEKSTKESVQGDLTIAMHGESEEVTSFRIQCSRPATENLFSVVISLHNRGTRPETLCTIGKKPDAPDEKYLVTVGVGSMPAIKLVMELSLLKVLIACRLFALHVETISENFPMIALTWNSGINVHNASDLGCIMEMMSV